MKKKIVTAMLVAMVGMSTLTACSFSTSTNFGSIDVYEVMKDADIENYKDVLSDLDIEDSASSEKHAMKNGDGTYTFKIKGTEYVFTVDDLVIQSVSKDGAVVWTIEDAKAKDMIDELPTDVIDDNAEGSSASGGASAAIAEGIANGMEGATSGMGDDIDPYEKVEYIDETTGQELFAVCNYEGGVIFKFIEPEGYHIDKEYVKDKYGKNMESLFFLKSDTNSSEVDISNSCPAGLVYLLDEENAPDYYEEYAAKFEIAGLTDPSTYNQFGYVIAEDEYCYYAVVYGSEYESFVLKTNKLDATFKNRDTFVDFVLENF